MVFGVGDGDDIIVFFIGSCRREEVEGFFWKEGEMEGFGYDGGGVIGEVVVGELCGIELVGDGGGVVVINVVGDIC